MKKLITLLLLLFFLGGLGAEWSFINSAEGRPRKVAYKKIYRKKIPKKYQRVKIKKSKRYSKKKKAVRKIHRKPYKKVSKPAKSPSTPQLISQNYTLEEGFDEIEADRIRDVLLTLGVKEVQTDVDTNSVSVKFDKSKISAVHIIQKLKSLGYTIKRID
jgi:copper chaperone CopZ